MQFLDLKGQQVLQVLRKLGLNDLGVFVYIDIYIYTHIKVKQSHYRP
jgi:hypothetical protein